jgi:UDPglucose 6-dehydrogenase
MLGAVQRVNERQRALLGARVVSRFGADLHGLTFAVWGLAFKPGTDDLREAPSLVVIDELLRRGARVQAFDPVAMPGVAALWPDRAGLELVGDPLAAVAGASALLVVTEWREFRSPDFAALHAAMRTPVVFDGRNLYDPAVLQSLGFEYIGIGRAAEPAAATSAVVDLRLRSLAA